MAPRALPTYYNGTLFRSRLEAKHARVFDGLDLKWIHEPQGYRSRGTNYLPDFMLFAACGTLYVEIKPAIDNDPDGVKRWRSFAAERPDPGKTRAVLLAGKPSVNIQAVVIGGDEDAGDPVNGPWEDDAQIWRPCPSGAHFDMAFPGRFFSKFAPDGCEDKFGGLGEEAIADAVYAANSERFVSRPTDPTGTAA